MFEINDLVVEDVLKINKLSLSSKMISIEGQSGSGKSTLLRLLNNLDDPASGRILYRDKELISIPPQELRKKIVMVPQNPVMFEGTIRDNLIIGQKISGQSIPSDEELKEMLDLLWIEKDLDTESSDISGGQKQRIALGRVLLMEKAEVYLLDEPSSDLDDKTANHIMKLFIETAGRHNKQVIMVTHDKEVSKKFADNIINMDEYSKQISWEEDEA